jgi:acyl-CoA synthetase (NDP forming)
VKVYPDLAQVPDPVDLAVIVLPVGMILESMRDCAERGIKAVIIITGGFREVGGKARNSRERRWNLRVNTACG